MLSADQLIVNKCMIRIWNIICRKSNILRMNCTCNICGIQHASIKHMYNL